MPEEVQYKALRLIPGLENVKMFRPGYAIEYDYFPPTQLSLSLETHLVKGLFFAGQINGTTGYEEAACQGFMAGWNAALQCKEQEPVILSRAQAYIGVLIDDLVNKGTEEPYRMFTSRAEYRILLRQDNADIRLTKLAAEKGMNPMDSRISRVNDKLKAVEQIRQSLSSCLASPTEVNGFLEKLNSSPIDQKTKYLQLLTRPDINLKDLMLLNPILKEEFSVFDDEILESAEINIKYEGYIKREQEMVEKMQRLESVKLPAQFDYHKIAALSNEAKTKLSKVRPLTIGQAGRISGVSPADVSVLLVFLGR